MKLNKTMKKLIAYVCAFAMVVAGMTGYQAKVSAAEAPDGYTEHEEGWITFGEIIAEAPNADKTPVSKWAVYSGTSWAAAKIATKGGSDSDETVSIFATLNDNMNQWGIQLVRVITDLEPITEYDWTIDYTIDGEAGSITQIATSDADGKIAALIGIGNVLAEGQNFEVTGVSAEKYDAEAAAKVEEKIMSDDNIAKSKSTFASSENAKNGPEGPASNIVDGSLTSRWIAKTKDPEEYVGVNLGGLYSVSSVALKWEGAYASEYEIQVSTDGINYNTVATKKALRKDSTEITLDSAVDAQFVKVVCKAAGTEWNYSIFEMGVFGEYKGEGVTTKPVETEPPVDHSDYLTSTHNIAKGAAVTASTTDPMENGGNGAVSAPANLTDGVIGSYWASYFTAYRDDNPCPEEYTDNDNVVIDLGKVYDATTLEKIVVAWRTVETFPAFFNFSSAFFSILLT